MAFRSTIPFRQLCIGKSQNSAFQTELLKFSFSFYLIDSRAGRKGRFLKIIFPGCRISLHPFPSGSYVLESAKTDIFRSNSEKIVSYPQLVASGEEGILQFLEQYFSFLSPVIIFNPLNPPNYRTLRFEREFFNLFFCPNTKGTQQQKIDFSNGQKRRAAM